MPATTHAPDGAAPVMGSASAAAPSLLVPPARAIAESFPGSGDERQSRVLLAVAEGIGDPDSAEAQAAETLNRLEAAVSRARAGTSPSDQLVDAVAAADQGVQRLLRLPGSAPDAGVALAGALVEDGRATLTIAGSATALLVRDGVARPLAGTGAAQRSSAETRIGQGAAGTIQPGAPIELRPGDTLLLCTAGVAHGLGARIVHAVVEEYGAAEAAQELSELTVQLGSGGGAVALFHLPAAAPGTAAAPAAVLPEPPLGSRPRYLALAVLGAAVLIGAIVAVVAVLLVSGAGGGKHASPPAPTVAQSSPVSAPASALLPQGSPRATAALTSPALSPTTSAARTPGPRATPASVATPSDASALPVCAAGTAPPCRYAVQAGDSVSGIGNRFGVSLACFEAANRNHTPVPPTAANGDRIGAGEEYVISDPAACTARAPAGAASPSSTAAAATATAQPTPRPACTPHPGAAAPNPFC